MKILGHIRLKYAILVDFLGTDTSEYINSIYVTPFMCQILQFDFTDIH